MVKHAKLKDVYGHKSVEDQREIYKNWAETYDAETLGEFGWMGFKPAAEEFAKRISNKDARILDAGCGTGLSGTALSEQGFTNIHGCDLSPEMLEQAKKTGVYKSLTEVDLTNSINVKEPYDAIFSCGVFGFGPPFPEHLHHLIDILKSEGQAIITVNGKGWVDTNWSENLPKAIEKSDLQLSETLDIEYLENEGIKGKLLIFRA